MPTKRSKPAAAAGAFTVSGPGVDRAAASRGGAIVYAQGVAERSKDVVTLYVRDVIGGFVARIERDGDGVVRTFTEPEKNTRRG